MILDQYVVIYITNRNINFYKNKGYDFKINNYYKVSVLDLNSNSMSKVNIECDICKKKRYLSFQKYNKSISNGGYYCCKSCSHEKVQRDLVRLSKSISESKKNKFDKITKEIEISGRLNCNKCGISLTLENFGKNRNGRYSKVCRECKSLDFKIYFQKLDKEVKKNRKRKYYRNSLHLNLWRSVLKSYLFRKDLKKNEQTINLLGYSSLDLREHIESKFDKNMTWENYGTYWHIDHIIPISIFRIDAPVSIVNSLSNLRPLEKNKNLIKGNKIDKDSLLIIDEFQTFIEDKYINFYKNKIEK